MTKLQRVRELGQSIWLDYILRSYTSSGNLVTMAEVAEELSVRLTRLFLRDSDGRRPAHGEYAKFRDDPHFRDYVLFFEYFHGDSGRGVGASHQTGRTGLVATLLKPRRSDT